MRSHRTLSRNCNNRLDAIGVPELIRRLLRRNHHLLALRISEYMKLKQEVVLVDWACSMVCEECHAIDRGIYFTVASQHQIKRSRDTDEELCTRIVAKLGSHDVSFAQIAKLAFDSGRPLLSSRVEMMTGGAF